MWASMDEKFMKTDHNMLKSESNAVVYFDQFVGSLQFQNICLYLWFRQVEFLWLMLILDVCMDLGKPKSKASVYKLIVYVNRPEI